MRLLVAAHGVCSIEAPVTRLTLVGAWVGMQCRHVLTLDRLGLEGCTTDVTEEWPHIRMDSLMLF